MALRSVEGLKAATEAGAGVEPKHGRQAALRTVLLRTLPRLGGVRIRTKLLWLILALLLIPWMGYQYLQEMERFLLKGQEDALMLTARAISTVLNDRPELFRPDTGVPELLGGQFDLYAHQLDHLLQMDGDVSDWGRQLEHLREFTGDSYFECTATYDPGSLSLRHMLGYRGRFVYGLFMVTDDRLIYRDLALRPLDTNDQIRLTIQDPPDRLRRYLLTSRRDGRMSMYLMDQDWRYPVTGDPVYEMTAVLMETDDGYNVELRIPRYLLGSSTRLGFEVVDVDDPDTRVIRQTMATHPNVERYGLSRVLLHSPELAKILGGLDRPIARIWILDDQQRVRAVVGSLSSRAAATDSGQPAADGAWLRRLLDRIVGLAIRLPESEFNDIELDVSRRTDAILPKVLTGTPQSDRRRSLDERAEILVAAHPIYTGDQVLGAVVVEQSSGEVLSLQNAALRNVTAVTLLVFLFLAAAVVVFASRITVRIGRLRDTTESAISPEGRVRRETIDVDTSSGDEIGDLARSISSMLTRLGQYTRYLEAMPDTLAHELNNPLNVVNSSLENLEDELPMTRHSKYMERAKNGIVRLRSILVSLTEAANLEEALQNEELEQFDLSALVAACVEGYQSSHPDHRWQVTVGRSPLPISGEPERIAQLLDKLVDNAVQFGRPGGVIEVIVDRRGSRAELSVVNEGSRLPESMNNERLFDPMVSLGKKHARRTSLGLGLFIARLIAEHHQGTIVARNRDDGDGVIVTVSLPCQSP